MAFQVLGLAAPARAAIEGALQCGRCGIDADSHAAPRVYPRTRREVPASATRPRIIGRTHMSVNGVVLRAIESL